MSFAFFQNRYVDSETLFRKKIENSLPYNISIFRCMQFFFNWKTIPYQISLKLQQSITNRAFF